ncbi:hypothetical protein HS088_TW14G00240 [Tripterygium wilfordii]|uniref:Protein Lines C-terminal domain-containing protein n=1 Tax=Tripterygium wilfordii TaxID=458696 RepID=A0A7J7CQF5_TRIWF|nr:uncharacterized protein LOC120015262 [Tripterygium wilfordii]KAF5736106.1 hypothetical protein HS088_TW14G00240 [Tripterygium wilfordii]
MSAGDESSCDYSRLYLLIHETLLPHIEFEMIVLTKEKEKDLLIALSQVFRKIQMWTCELDENSDEDVAEKATCEKRCLELQSYGHPYLTYILADLVTVLKIDCQYVQHLAGNVLVIIAEFLAASGRKWNIFIQLLCICLELAIANISISFAPSTAGADVSYFDSSSFFAVVSLKLKNATWTTVAGIIRVLRSILKNIKQDCENQLVEIYVHSISSCILNLPWDSLDGNILGQKDDAPRRGIESFLINNVDENEPRVIFLGNLIQLLCSLVEQIIFMQVKGGSLECSVLRIIVNLIPKLLSWCLGKQGDCVNMPVSEYFRHKLLMLMIRLSFQNCLEYSIFVSWLQLLHQFYPEFLLKPIAESESVPKDSLEGSPFLSGISDGELYGMHSCHLQRQAIFLFLRCSISLINQKGETDKHSEYATPNSCLTFGSSSDLDSCSRKKGLSELHKWLQKQLPNDMIVDYRRYWGTCINFSTAFLQLFMHEDDLLFKVLFELLSVPLSTEEKFHEENWACQDVKENIVFHVSNIFNPVHIFHLFLAELHYDHEVLLDYLISKDTGVSCAEYLLRCLRIICNSWHLFVEFSVNEQTISQTSCKKRKTIFDADSQPRLSSASVMDVLPSREKERRKGDEIGCKHYKTSGQPFKEGKDCLLSLKKSVENLHGKNLFPYNPEVLLKRLTRFQELCFIQWNYDQARTARTS